MPKSIVLAGAGVRGVPHHVDKVHIGAFEPRELHFLLETNVINLIKLETLLWSQLVQAQA